MPNWPGACARLQGPQQTECFVHLTSDWARLSRYRDANVQLAAPGRGEERVVFIGASITDNWSKPESGGFFSGRHYVNRGIGGQVSGQMLQRFRQDVLALSPRVVVLDVGSNDMAGNAGRVTADVAQSNVATMSELASLHGASVVLASLTPIADGESDKDGKAIVRSVDRPPAAIVATNRWLAEYARAHGHVYLDYNQVLVDDRGQLRADLTEDGLHVNAAGYALMAPVAEAAIARALRARPAARVPGRR
jgi:lysophospholipase L1-like esterase